jgi:hypothetical protein
MSGIEIGVFVLVIMGMAALSALTRSCFFPLSARMALAARLA